MAERKPVRQRALQLEYRFDRLLPDKLAQVYQVLVPDQALADWESALGSTSASLGGPVGLTPTEHASLSWTH